MRFFKRKHNEPNTHVGRAVFTADAHHVGDVKAAEDGALLISSPLSRDYWLSERDVDSFAEERLVLVFAKDELDDYKRETPPPETVPEGIPTSTHVAWIDTEEQMRVRERMEQELAEQRRNLPND